MANRKRPGTPVLGALAVLAALAVGGCSVAVETVPGIPDVRLGDREYQDAVTEGLLTGQPVAAWADAESAQFFLTLYGSSSCAPFPTAVVETDDPQRIEVLTSTGIAILCTADLSATTYLLDAPDTLDPSLEGEVAVAGFDIRLAAVEG